MLWLNAIRKITKRAQLEKPASISSNKLGTHIAKITQLLGLTQDEAKQVHNFMGHTEKLIRSFMSKYFETLNYTYRYRYVFYFSF